MEDGGGGGSGNEANQQHADLESGVAGDVDACSGPRVNLPATTQAPAPSFFKLLQKSCKSYSNFLLFLSAVLSIGFGIKEEGAATGWLKGLILMGAAIILVFLQIIGLLVFIFILVGSFLRYMLGRKDGDSGLPEIEGKATFCVALAIIYWRKKTLPAMNANIAQEMPALCTMRPATSDKADMMDLADKIYEMANPSPSDKQSQEVLMVGDRSGLKEADVGVAMGTRSREIARDPECSEITMTIVSLLITFIATICRGHSTISIFQLFWVDTVVTLPIGFALLMEPPSEEEELMEQPPVGQTKGLNIRNTMWRNILIQAACQIIILVTLQQLKGETFPVINQKVSESMVFNTFVLFQLFNQINARQTEKKNVFSGILRHPWCLVSFGVTLILQVNFIEIEHILAGSARLNWEEWGVCLLIGMTSWPIDFSGKCASHVIKKVRDSYLSRSTTTSLIPSPK